MFYFFFFFQAEDGIRDSSVTGVQTCALPISWGKRPDQMPVFGTMASRFNDDGVTALYQALKARLHELGMKLGDGRLPLVHTRHSTHQVPIVPGARVRYLAEIADAVRGYRQQVVAQSHIARELQQLDASLRM